MLVIIVQTVIPVRKIDDKISVVMLFVVSFLWAFRVHFGSVFRIINLELRDF
jgi:hypothetical protein